MRRFKLAIIALGSTALSATFCWFRLHTDANPAGALSLILSPTTHRATAVMITSADHSTGRMASPFRAKASDGETYSLAEWNAKWPVVLVFIKDGCPCSKSAERYFQQLHAAGGGWVPFFGVIDGDESVARRWTEENGTTYPILADPKLAIIRAYGAENSAYVALIAQGGRIERLWPGYSAGMLRGLTDGMKRLSGRDIELIEAASDAPEDLYSGCPFDL